MQDNLYEIEQKYHETVNAMFEEINQLLAKYNLPSDTVEYLQVKSKWTKIRVYWYLPRLTEISLDDDCDEDEYHLYVKLQTEIDEIVDRAENVKFN